MLRDWVDLIENHTFAAGLAYTGLLFLIYWIGKRLERVFMAMRGTPKDY